MKKLRFSITVDFEPVAANYQPDESALEVERQNLAEMGAHEYLTTFDEDDNMTVSIDVVEE